MVVVHPSTDVCAGELANGARILCLQALSVSADEPAHKPRNVCGVVVLSGACLLVAVGLVCGRLVVGRYVVMRARATRPMKVPARFCGSGRLDPPGSLVERARALLRSASYLKRSPVRRACTFARVCAMCVRKRIPLLNHHRACAHCDCVLRTQCIRSGGFQSLTPRPRHSNGSTSRHTESKHSVLEYLYTRY